MEVSNYELMVAVNPKTGVDSLASKIKKFVEDADASSVSVDKMGKKQLAYPIRKNSEAEYVVFNFEAEGNAVSSIVSKLRLEEETVLRYILVKQKAKGKKFAKEVEAVDIKTDAAVEKAEKKAATKKTSIKTKSAKVSAKAEKKAKTKKS